MEFRYGSGLTTYSEKFESGRLISLDYHASGLPQNPNERIKTRKTSAFALEIDGRDATFGWELSDWQKGRANDGRPFASLVLNNTELAIQLTITTLSDGRGYFSRKMLLKNLSEKPVSLTRVSPLCGSLWELTDDIEHYMEDEDLAVFTVGGFQEKSCCLEGSFSWNDVPHNGRLTIGSDTGRSGHSHPFAIVHNRILGGYFVCQMAWSGNWSFGFQSDYVQNSHLRLAFDLAPSAPAPMRILDPSEELELPEIIMGYVYTDFDGAVQGLHDYQRKYMLLDPPLGYELTCCDHWGYEGHDMCEDAAMVQIDRAAEIGAELFMVDAGWYGERGSSWKTTVGDWYTSRLPNDLNPIIDHAHKKGLYFGLWVEPEAIGKESRLLKEHPDWLMKRYGQPMERCLDLSRPEVEAYIEAALMNIIERYSLDMLRLDFNNPNICEGGFNRRGEYNENTLWRYNEAVHRIFDHIHERYPKLMLENCASGGGRTDLSMMSRFSKTQITDWYKLPRSARIFNGMSICLPPERLMMMFGAGMSPHRYGWGETQMQLLVIGIPRISGIAPVDEEPNPALVKRLSEYLTLYKTFIRPIQKECKVYHHTPVVPGFSGRGFVGLEFMLPDASQGYALVVRLPGTDKCSFNFMPKGLDMTRKYSITFVTGGKKAVVDGYTLSTEGLTLTLDGPLTSQMLLIEAI